MASVPLKDSTYRNFGAIFDKRTAAQCATHLIPHIQPHHRILDVGCGRGSITLDLARLVPEGHVIGTDIDDRSLAVARRFAEEQGVTNVEFREANAENLSTAFPPESFDVVHAHQVLVHVRNPHLALQEMRQVVKSGGLVSTRDTQQAPVIYPELKQPAPVAQGVGKLFKANGVDLTRGRTIHVLAHEAGFAWDKIEISSWGWEHSGDESRRLMANSSKYNNHEALRRAGTVTEADLEGHQRAWEEWAENPAGRVIGLDTALICWK